MPDAALRSAVFLDRDGVIIEDTHYLHRPECVQFLPGALEAVASMNAIGIPVVVVTNQAGIGRGYYEWKDFELVQARIECELSSVGGWFDGVWACGYHPEGGADHPANQYRKPNPGMLNDAAMKLRLDLSRSWVAGDKQCDIEVGINAGLRGAVHVLTGYGRKSRADVIRLARDKTLSCQIHYFDAIRDMVSLVKVACF